jgi:hypothetical protein
MAVKHPPFRTGSLQTDEPLSLLPLLAPSWDLRMALGCKVDTGVPDAWFLYSREA